MSDSRNIAKFINFFEKSKIYQSNVSPITIKRNNTKVMLEILQILSYNILQTFILLFTKRKIIYLFITLLRYTKHIYS